MYGQVETQLNILLYNTFDDKTLTQPRCVELDEQTNPFGVDVEHTKFKDKYFPN